MSKDLFLEVREQEQNEQTNKPKQLKQNKMNKLLEFQKKIQVIKKDAKNPHFKNTYATLGQILSEVKPILSELGLTLTQPIVGGNVATFIYEGDKLLCQSEIPLPTNLTPQQLGSAITYFRRYNLASLLALEIDDDDANSTNKAVTETKTMTFKTEQEIKDAYANGQITKEAAIKYKELITKI